MPESGGASLVKNLTLIIGLTVIRLAGRLRRRGAMADSVHGVFQPTTSSPSSSPAVQIGSLPKFLDQ